MAVRDQPGARTDPLATDPESPVIVVNDGSRSPTRSGWLLGLALPVGALILIGAGSWWAAGRDATVEARAAVEAPAPALVDVPGALALTVRAPARVVAGEPARFLVSFTDGEGIFSGTVEDWGEAGVGSASEAACGADAPAAAPLDDRYVVTHTWAEAGTYPVSFAVTSYVCTDGRAIRETRNAALAVVVDAR